MSRRGSHIEFGSGGGCGLRLLGLFVALFGSVFVGLPILYPDSMNEAPPLPFLVMGAGGIIAGFCIAFAFRRTRIEGLRNRIETSWGVLIPFSRRESPLIEPSHAAVERQVIRSNKSSRTVYPVKIVLAGGEEFLCTRPGRFEEARSAAERIAGLLGLDLHDLTSGAPKIREAAYLDENIRDRAARLGLEPVWPDDLPTSRIRHSIRGGDAVFELPAAGMQAPMILLVVAGALFGLPFATIGGGVAMSVIRDAGDGPGVVFGWIFAAAFVLPILGLILKGIDLVRKHETVTVSSRRVQSTTHHLIGSRSRELPVAEIEEFDLIVGTVLPDRLPPNVPPALMSGILGFLGFGGRITVRGDKGTFDFGRGLKPDELQWLHTAVNFVMMQPPGA